MIAVGHVYESEYGVRYQVLAIWDDFVWVHVSSARLSRQPDKWREPKTQELDFLRQDGFRLLYELPA